MADGKGERWKRLGWFAGLWLGGVATVIAVSYLIKLLMAALG